MSEIIKNGNLIKGYSIELDEGEEISWHFVGELMFLDSSTFNPISKLQAKQLIKALQQFTGDEK